MNKKNVKTLALQIQINRKLFQEIIFKSFTTKKITQGNTPILSMFFFIKYVYLRFYKRIFYKIV